MLALLISTCLFPHKLAAQQAQQLSDDPTAICQREQEKESAVVRGFVFKTYEDDIEDPACLQVFHDGKVVFREAESAKHYYLGQPAERKWKIPFIENGRDVTGRGHPDMIVSQWSGGAHCCTTHYVFELEPDFKLIATIDDRDYSVAHFERDDGHYIYKTADWTFAYWPSCFACSPSTQVVLRFTSQNGGGFHLALDKMKRPRPTKAEWEGKLREVQKVLSDEGPQVEIGRTQWQFVLDLIYSGHSDLAWKFLDDTGPKAQAGDLPKLAEFCSIFMESPYWPDIAPTLLNAPPECSNAIPKSSE